VWFQAEDADELQGALHGRAECESARVQKYARIKVRADAAGPQRLHPQLTGGSAVYPMA
jgi:hypothetical protein